MTMRYFYIKTPNGLGLDKHGRETDNISAWHLYSNRMRAINMAAICGCIVGIL